MLPLRSSWSPFWTSASALGDHGARRGDVPPLLRPRCASAPGLLNTGAKRGGLERGSCRQKRAPDAEQARTPGDGGASPLPWKFCVLPRAAHSNPGSEMDFQAPPIMRLFPERRRAALFPLTDLVRLWGREDAGTWRCDAPQSAVAEALGVHTRTVHNLEQELQRANVLRIERVPGSTARVLVLTPPAMRALGVTLGETG